jgi:hypothetical protein
MTEHCFFLVSMCLLARSAWNADSEFYGAQLANNSPVDSRSSSVALAVYEVASRMVL